MKTITRSKGGNGEDFAQLRAEFLSLMDHLRYQLSVLIAEALETKHPREFEEWLVSPAIPFACETDLFERLFKEHQQANQFMAMSRIMQSLWDFRESLSGPSAAPSGTVKPRGKGAGARPATLEELKSRTTDLREVHDVTNYMLACLEHGESPSMAPGDFADPSV